MTMLTGLINKAKYSLLRASVKNMSYGDQRKIALATYETIDDAYKAQTGDNVGVCTVNFQCPYDGHVSYHCIQVLSGRKGDPSDILSDYALEKVGESDWRLTVVVATSDTNPHRAADAAAMSAVLRIPTVVGDFNRSYGMVPVMARSVKVAEITFC